MSETGGAGAVVLGAADRAALVAAAKTLLGIAISEQDELIGALGESALALAEAFTGQVMIARPIVETIAAGGEWARLSSAPVSAIIAAATVSPDGGTTPIDPGFYQVDIDAAGDGWVRSVGAGQLLAISLSAGLATDWASLPIAIRQGVVLLAAHLYDNRDGAGAPPAAVTALWRPFRRMRLADRAPA